MVNPTDRIIPIDQLDGFEVAEGDPDVRGWDVLFTDGRKLGEVDNLLIDPSAMKVRYLDVGIEHEHLTDGVDRHILIPIGYARLDENDDRIFVDALSPTTLNQIPAYRHETLTADYETELRRHFDSGYIQQPATSGDFYSDEVYSDDRFYGPRRS